MFCFEYSTCSYKSTRSGEFSSNFGVKKNQTILKSKRSSEIAACTAQIPYQVDKNNTALIANVFNAI